MKILLTGATGQLGQEWQQAVKGDEEINLWPYSSAQLDITDKEKLLTELQSRRPDVVINCAAYTDVDGAEEHRQLAQKVNTEAAEYLAKFSAKLGFKLVHYSTDYVFPGKEKHRDKFPRGYPEDYPADPINWYGKTKWEGEQAIRNNTANHLILRLSWLCGQFRGNFVKTMLRLGRDRDQLQVVADQWGSPTFTSNVVDNTLRLLEAEKNGTYHVTSRGLITWYDFAKAIFEKSGIKVKVEPVSSEAFPTKAERPCFSKMSTKKLESVAGSKIIDWREGLEELLNQLETR